MSANWIDEALLVTLFATAWFIYQYQAPWQLYRRRAWLAHYTLQGGSLRRLLWRQTFSLLFLSVRALFAATFLIVFASGLARLEWYTLLAGLPLFLILVLWPPRILLREVASTVVGLARLRLAVVITTLLTTVALVLLTLFWLDMPDYRGSNIRALLTSEYETGSRTGGAVFGPLFGLNAAMDAALWFVMQSAAAVAAELPRGVKIAAWGGFLIVKTATAALFWTAIAGLLGFLWSCRGVARKGPPRLSGHGQMAFVVIALLALLSGGLLQNPGWLTLMGKNISTPFASLESSCVSPQQRDQLRAESSQHLDTETAASLARIESRVDDQLATIYRSAEQGVDEFLDWHYSIRGQYSQLGVWAASRLGGESYEDFIQSRMVSFVSEPMENQLAALNNDLQSAFEFEVANLGRQHANYLDSLMNEDCLQLGVAMPALPVQLARTTAGFGSIAGLSSYAVTRFGARYAAQRGGQVVATRSASRFASRAATSGVSSSSGVLCGPLVVVCAPVLAAGAWVGTDWLINRADEAMHREELKQVIMEALEAERLERAAGLMAAYQTAMQDIENEVQAWQQQRYRILRDGV